MKTPEYGGRAPDFYLVYLGTQTLAGWDFKIPRASPGTRRPVEGMKFTAEVLDTWNMSLTPVPGEFTLKKKDDYFYADAKRRTIPLSGKPYMAIRIKALKERL